VIAYEFLLPKFASAFPDRHLKTISAEEVLTFLARPSE
jgi:hypothetical protein